MTEAWHLTSGSPQVNVAGLHADGALDRDHGFLASLVGEHLAADHVGKREGLAVVVCP